jgi:hypothetical protein
MSGEISKIGKILRILELPCAPTPTMYVQSVEPAIIDLFWSFVKPDFKEDFKIGDQFRNPGRKGRSALKFVRQSFGEATKASPAARKAAGKAVFEILEWGDQLSWYLFLAELATDFLFNWTSIAYSMAGCDPNPTYTVIQLGPPLFYYGQGPGWQPIAAWNMISPTPGTIVGSAWPIPPGKAGTMAGWAKSKGFVGPYVPIQTRVRVVETGQILDSDMSSELNADGTSGSISFASGWGPDHTGFTVVFEFTCDTDSAYGAAEWIAGSLSIAIQN